MNLFQKAREWWKIDPQETGIAPDPRRGFAMTTVETTLSNKMFALINERGEAALPEGFKAAAIKFNKATDGYYGAPQTVDVQHFLAAYAKARRLWCEATGEPLV